MAHRYNKVARALQKAFPELNYVRALAWIEKNHLAIEAESETHKGFKRAAVAVYSRLNPLKEGDTLQATGL